IWERLEDDDPTVLKDVAGPIEDTDAVWAFQWDKTLGPGDSLVISKDKLIMPEPATLVLMGAGMAITLAARRRRRR
ncbi:MAG TPA: PEP-CTERM sorting domain-containing protein, partial [Phycisphaerae bacterium]|nr:PEP-CTERM sorting domain-containing protein [Phycisphaerae bacterium]